MKQPSVLSVDNLGAFQKQFREKRWPPVGRLIVLVSGILFVILILLVQTGLLVGNMVFLVVPVLIILGPITVIGLYLFVKGLVVETPTAVAVYEEGLVFVTAINAKPQVVRWNQVAEAWVVEGATGRRVRYGKGPWQEEYVDLDYRVKSETGRTISFGPLRDGEDLFDLVASASHVRVDRRPR